VVAWPTLGWWSIGCGGKNINKQTYFDVIKEDVWFINTKMLDRRYIQLV
jgi:hypothetical protein